MEKIVLIFVVSVAFAAASPVFNLVDEEGQELEMIPVLSRQRRQEPPRWTGGGAGNRQQQNGWVNLQNPNGSGGGASVFHQKGYGTDVGVNAMVPVWQRPGRNGGGSTLNLGGGVNQHFGGPGGSRTLDKSVGLNFVHRF